MRALLKIVLVTLSATFTIFGYKIYFQKKYNLINGFEEVIKQEGKQNNMPREWGWQNLSLELTQFYLESVLLLSSNKVWSWRRIVECEILDLYVYSNLVDTGSAIISMVSTPKTQNN